MQSWVLHDEERLDGDVDVLSEHFADAPVSFNGQYFIRSVGTLVKVVLILA